MKHVKMLGLLVMAAASLMAFASSASAATLTSPAGTEYTGEITSSLEKGSSALLKAGIEDTCTSSTTAGTVTTNTSTEASGALSSLTFGGCTQDTVVKNAGSLKINSAGEVFTSGSRVEVTVTSIFGNITCFYGAETGSSVKIGTFVGGTPAKLNVSTTSLQRLSGSNTSLCAEKGTWTGTYVVTSPSTLLLN